jgi:hypothetical protein
MNNVFSLSQVSRGQTVEGESGTSKINNKKKLRLANWNPPLSYGHLSLADETLLQIALRAAYLEKQNTHLKITLNTLNVENAGIKVTRFSVLCLPY